MNIDQTDLALLAQLKVNARASVTTLAGHLGLSRATVQNRMERLQAKGVIRRYTVETDPSAGLEQVQAIMLIALTGPETTRITRTLRAKPEIVELHSTNGAWDLVARIEVSNLADFDRVLREIREVSGIMNSETCLLLKRQ